MMVIIAAIYIYISAGRHAGRQTGRKMTEKIIKMQQRYDWRTPCCFSNRPKPVHTHSVVENDSVDPRM